MPEPAGEGAFPAILELYRLARQGVTEAELEIERARALGTVPPDLTEALETLRTKLLTAQRAVIRVLNDQLRGNLTTGRVVITNGVRMVGPEFIRDAVRAVVAFEAFSEDNDPHGEHHFGSFELHNRRLFWKIDYYDRAYAAGSEDPANPEITARVLTIMLVEEY